MEFFASIQKLDTFFQNKTFFKSLTLTYCKIETCILMPIPSKYRSKSCLRPVQIVLDWFQIFWTFVKEQNSVLIILDLPKPIWTS